MIGVTSCIKLIERQQIKLFNHHLSTGHQQPTTDDSIQSEMTWISRMRKAKKLWAFIKGALNKTLT